MRYAAEHDDVDAVYPQRLEGVLDIGPHWVYKEEKEYGICQPMVSRGSIQGLVNN
jgi:hypothetical protein